MSKFNIDNKKWIRSKAISISRIVKICVCLLFSGMLLIGAMHLGNKYLSSLDKCPFAPSEDEAFATLAKFIDAEASGNIEGIRELYTEEGGQRFDKWVSKRGPEVVRRFLQKKMQDVALINYTGIGRSGDDCGKMWVMVAFQDKDNNVVSQAEYHLEATADEGGENRRWLVAFVLPVEVSAKQNAQGETEVVNMG